MKWRQDFNRYETSDVAGYDNTRRIHWPKQTFGLNEKDGEGSNSGICMKK